VTTVRGTAVNCAVNYETVFVTGGTREQGVAKGNFTDRAGAAQPTL
jgi:hypothetical protein